jgi:hypothetical protein
MLREVLTKTRRIYHLRRIYQEEDLSGGGFIRRRIYQEEDLSGGGFIRGRIYHLREPSI